MSIQISLIIPAAGVGSRMKADRPKQYLPLLNKTVLEHTIDKLLPMVEIQEIILVVNQNDPYINAIATKWDNKVKIVEGGKERVDSVLAGLKSSLSANGWSLVHDAARPCVKISDIRQLINTCITHDCGGILASPVKDTIKRAKANNQIEQTICREQLWQAFTPQFFKTQQLITAIEFGLKQHKQLTDEASAIEYYGDEVILVESSTMNIKITHPEDLLLAELYLSQEQ